MTTIYPVILSGGNGTHLWLLPHSAFPKQLLALKGQKSMLQKTVRRASALVNKALLIQPPLLICNLEHRLLIREQSLATGT